MASRRMSERTQFFGALLLFVAIVGLVCWGLWRHAQYGPSMPQPFLEVVLDSEHPGALLCNKPDAKFVPCTVEVRGDGWAVHFQEAKP